MVMIRENTEIASAYLDCKLSDNLLLLRFNMTHAIWLIKYDHYGI